MVSCLAMVEVCAQLEVLKWGAAVTFSVWNFEKSFACLTRDKESVPDQAGCLSCVCTHISVPYCSAEAFFKCKLWG